MLLKKLILKNIRSFEDQTINFPKGIVLLEGDIGSGKTTILKAIEFGIFGTGPWLKAGSILRKGKNNGRVFLKFELGNKKITIKRELKKDNSGKIAQAKIQLIEDDISYLCSPTEARSKIINLLNYPKEMISKNPALLFRYTVYTPQEETKLILRISNEERNNIFGKLFSTEHYKLIRENSAKVKKALKENAEYLRGTFVDLGEKDKLFLQYENKLKQAKLQENETANQLNILKKQLLDLDEKEAEQKKISDTLLKLKNEKEIKQNQHREKTLFLNDLIKNQEQNNKTIINLEKQIKENFAHLLNYDFNENYCKKLKQEKTNLEKTIEEFNSNKNNLQIKIAQNKQTIAKEKSIVSKQSEINYSLENCQKQEENIKKFIAQNSSVEEILKQKEIELKQNQNFISSSNTKIKMIKKEMQQISDLSVCPLCKQEIGQNHKNGIFSSGIESIKYLELEGQKYLEDEKLIEEKTNILKKKLAEFNNSKEKLIFSKKEIERLAKEMQNSKEEQNQIIALKKENEKLIHQLEELNQNFNQQDLKNKITETEKKIIDFEKIKKDIERKNDFEKYINDAKQRQRQNNNSKKREAKSITDLSKEISILNNKINLFNDVEEKLNAIINKKKILQEKIQGKKINQAEFLTQINTINEQKEILKKQINQMTESKKKFKKIKQIENWIENLFVPLVKNIENNVLARIHREFENLFCRWFFLLIEDNFFSAYINEDFCPVIEQNGFNIDFNNLSGGEQTAVALCYRLALNQVINSITKQIKTSDIIILDEPTDGFSQEQLDKLGEVMGNLSLSQIIIVSHEQKMRSFADNIISLKKTDNVSVVV